MMTLQEVKKAVDQLTENERAELRAYLDQSPAHSLKQGRGATPEERVQRLQAAAAAIREGLTEEELAEMTAAMNEDYIEPVDEDVWQD